MAQIKRQLLSTLITVRAIIAWKSTVGTEHFRRPTTKQRTKATEADKINNNKKSYNLLPHTLVSCAPV